MAKKKIYLSAAAHATDNPTKCPDKCGENTHCNAYMDIVEKRLKQLGFEVKRGDKKLTGDRAMTARVTEANSWGADLYYVAHTNAGGGRYSMTMCWPAKSSVAMADVLHAHRKCVPSHKVMTRTDLYEINTTDTVCLYDELFFHDNTEDCRWFHSGGMEKLAEETVQAICEMFGVTYKVETKPDKPVAPPVKAEKAPIVTYRVRAGGKWLPAVTDLKGSSGTVGTPITDVAVKVSAGSVKYRVHIMGGSWLPYVTGYNTGDYNNGYAGAGRVIDAIQIIYTQAKGAKSRKAKYRVSPTKSGYWPWQTNVDKNKSMDGYAGAFGTAMDRLQISLE